MMVAGFYYVVKALMCLVGSYPCVRRQSIYCRETIDSSLIGSTKRICTQQESVIA
jgi:hypothetical protein